MSESPTDRASEASREDRLSFADILDRVRWDYDPKKIPDDASPLATTERWFRDFPWDGLEDGRG